MAPINRERIIKMADQLGMNQRGAGRRVINAVWTALGGARLLDSEECVDDRLLCALTRDIGDSVEFWRRVEDIKRRDFNWRGVDEFGVRLLNGLSGVLEKDILIRGGNVNDGEGI